MSEYYSLYKGGTGEIEEKKSRFIANIAPVTTVEEANDFINATKKQYWDARHNCSAFIIGDNGENSRCSDDGEPSGTAGRPMLEVLSGEKITNVCVVVTRYFGGTLLGTGGLVRAYQGAVKEGLKSCSILKKIAGYMVYITCSYNDHGKLIFLFSQEGYYIEDTEYGSDVTLSVIVERTRMDDFLAQTADVTAGRAKLIDKEDIVYAIIDNRPQLM